MSKGTPFGISVGIKMKVIALCGKSDVGKTSILKKLMRELLNENELVDSRYKKETVLRMIDTEDEKWFTKKDKKNISNLTITLEFNGKLVTITSMGDSKDLIVGSLEGAKRRLIRNGNKEEIAIYICACHPKMNVGAMLGCDCVKYICKEKTEKGKINDQKVTKQLKFELNKLL